VINLLILNHVLFSSVKNGPKSCAKFYDVQCVRHELASNSLELNSCKSKEIIL